MASRKENGFEVSWITGVREDKDSNFEVRVQWRGYVQQSWEKVENAIGASWSIRKFIERFNGAIEDAEKAAEAGNADDAASTSSESEPEAEPVPSTSAAKMPPLKKKLLKKKVPEKLAKKASTAAKVSQ